MKDDVSGDCSSVFVGEWEIEWSEAWSREALHCVDIPYLEFSEDGFGSLNFVDVEGSIDCRYDFDDGNPRVQFSWRGRDGRHEACARGVFVYQSGVLIGHIYFHFGMESEFRAVKRQTGKLGKFAASPAWNMFQQLEYVHHDVIAEAEFNFLSPYIVRDSENRPVWESYLPWIGPGYEPGGIMVIATAQNLAKCVNTPIWNRATGLPDRAVYRQYRVGEKCVPRLLQNEEVDYSNIQISPWLEGILPGVIGMAVHALELDFWRSFNSITSNIVVTNFFKHALKNAAGNDLNPLSGRLPKSISKRYIAKTLRHYIKPELRILKPEIIFVFKNLKKIVEEAAPHARVVVLNDPSWIKQGMSGVAKRPNGSWYKRVASQEIPPHVEKLISNFIENMAPIYQSKSEAVRIFLLNYWLDLRKSH